MSTLQILIVDDEKGMRQGASRVLQKHKVQMPKSEEWIDFQTTTADCGTDAINKLENQQFDLVLLDYKLPDMTGLEILEVIQNIENHPMTIMITAFASLEVAVSATKNGAFDFLAKPFTPKELKTVITKATHSLVAMRQAQDLAEEKKKMRFQFLSVLSHELKSPLAAVEGYLFSLRDHILGDELSSYDKCIDRSLVRLEGMRKLIFDLLDLTRIESGKKKRDLQEIRVADAIEISLEDVASRASKKKIEIDFSGDLECIMQADFNELVIIANNLITNAVKYNKEGGKVKVTLKDDNDRIIFRVEDTGFGLSKEEQTHLFEEFIRIRNEQTRGIEGSGLGLSILKKLTRLYGGSVEVESQKNIGSIFTVVLKKNPEDHEDLVDEAKLTQV